MRFGDGFTNYYNSRKRQWLLKVDVTRRVWRFAKPLAPSRKGSRIMTTDEQLDRWTERPLALAESLQLLTIDVQGIAQVDEGVAGVDKRTDTVGKRIARVGKRPRPGSRAAMPILPATWSRSLPPTNGGLIAWKATRPDRFAASAMFSDGPPSSLPISSLPTRRLCWRRSFS